jgi:tellurite resistance protein TerC
MAAHWIFWVIFNVFVLAMLALDLGVFRRRTHAVEFRKAMIWVAVWFGLAAVFAVLLHWFGQTMVGGSARPNSQLSLEFITGYVIELSLSVDNLFVFLLVFRYFNVPRPLQHDVLFWGIIGALVMRGIFIFTGVELLDRSWSTAACGCFGGTERKSIPSRIRCCACCASSSALHRITKAADSSCAEARSPTLRRWRWC